LDFFTKKRKIEGCGRTRADVYSLSLGVKYILPTCTCFDLYVGLGPNISWLHINDRLMCGEECTRKCSFGGVVKTGINYYFCDNLFIDIFVDYLYQPTKIHHKHIDIGGLKTGIGLGVAF
jgi:outer membrane protein